MRLRSSPAPSGGREPPRPPLLSRRALLRGTAASVGAAAAAPLLAALASACGAPAPTGRKGTRTPGTTSPAGVGPAAGVEPAPAGAGPMLVGGAAMRPPAVPLAVRSPYLSTWLCGTQLAGAWATAWTGATTAVCGLARIDATTYVWCGDPVVPGTPLRNMTQTQVEVTPTRSIFTLEGGGVRLVAEWLSPVEPGRPRLQSAPLSLLTATVSATDGARHSVELYCDVTGQWASWLGTQEIVWDTSLTASRHWTIRLASQQPLSEQDEMASWGSAVFSSGPAASYQAGTDATVRAGFATRGRVADTVDTDFRAANDNTPVFALVADLGSVGAGDVSAHWAFGHVEEPAVEYLGRPLEPLWSRHWPSWASMVDAFLAGAPSARARAARLDAAVTAAARKAGGDGYAALCALALRQAYGACELVTGPDGRPWAFMKEISSDGDVSTTDVIFSSSAVWLALDPGYLAMLLEPTLTYAASGRWRKDFAPHGLGFWPLANGNPEGVSSEPMPVQESGGILAMVAAYSARVPSRTARAFLRRHEALWTRWADLLTTQLPIPPPQLTTVDWLGPQAGDTNLALLGIVGLGAAGQLAARLGDTATAVSRAATARRFASDWARLTLDRSGRHLVSQVGEPGGWSSLCNAVWDRVLGTGLVPTTVAATESSWYQSHLDPYGLPAGSSTPTLAMIDQELWTAAWLHDYPVGPELVELLARYAGHTDYLVPLSDIYDPLTGERGARYAWRARPVVGGLYALLLLPDGGGRGA